MKPFISMVALSLATFLFAPDAAQADDSHDHGGAPTAAGPSQPRFAAVSDAFELVGVLNGKQITLYLDRSADNSPVREAQIELDIAGAKYKAAKHGDDEYEVVLAEAPKAGVLPITATVTAGKEVDLLAGELDIHEDAHADEAHVHSWKEYAGWALGGTGVLALLVFAGRRAMASRRARSGDAA